MSELSNIRRPGWGHPLTLREIADMFGISRPRVQQILEKALQKLARNRELMAEARARGLLPGDE